MQQSETTETITERTIEVEADLEPGEVLKGILGDLDFVVEFSGHKSSEGDGRTAADIERERKIEEERRGAE